MVVPGLYDVPKVMAESSLSEEDILNLGFSADGLVFMVVVQELGACRVPDLALSHFMAGADEYAAEGMPEHWSKQPSGPWTIKRDRLRILADSWDKWHQMVCDRWITEPPDASEPQAPPVVANSASNAPVDGITTAQVAAIFDAMPFTAENWPKRLSDAKWLKPAQVALGAAGGATSLWCPATLARLIHSREQGTAKQKTIEALNRKFKSNPALEPWRTDWDEHYTMFNDADGSY